MWIVPWHKFGRVGDLLTLNDLEHIIERIYVEQAKNLRVNLMECEIVTSHSFPAIAAHTCTLSVDVGLGINNYQLLFALTQQIITSSRVLVD